MCELSGRRLLYQRGDSEPQNCNNIVGIMHYELLVLEKERRRKDEKADMLIKLYLSLFLSSKLIVFRQESKSKFESVVSEPYTSTSSLIYIYKRVSEKCVLLCKQYIRRMFDIPIDVGLCWYPVWTSSPVPFK